jgi:hypothetical protein
LISLHEPSTTKLTSTLKKKYGLLPAAFFCATAFTVTICAADPLPSWNEGDARNISKEGATGFVPIPERIAVFDKDATLCRAADVFPSVLPLLRKV